MHVNIADYCIKSNFNACLSTRPLASTPSNRRCHADASNPITQARSWRWSSTQSVDCAHFPLPCACGHKLLHHHIVGHKNTICETADDSRQDKIESSQLSAAPKVGGGRFRRRRPHRQLPQLRQLQQLRVHLLACRGRLTTASASIVLDASDSMLQHVAPATGPKRTSAVRLMCPQSLSTLLRTAIYKHELLNSLQHRTSYV